MFELIKNVAFAGFGAAFLTKEKATEIVNDLIEKGHLTKEEKTQRIKELMDTTETKVKEFSNIVEEKVKKAVDSIRLPERSEIEELKKQIEELKNQVNDLKSSNT